jgi:hypothetical protein
MHICAIPLAAMILIVAPPAQGRMLLVPLTLQARHDLPRLAINSGAALVGPGFAPGSLVVSGDRGALRSATADRAIVMVRGGGAGCAGRENGQ